MAAVRLIYAVQIHPALAISLVLYHKTIAFIAIAFIAFKAHLLNNRICNRGPELL